MYILKIVLNGVGETIMLRFRSMETVNYFHGKIQGAMERNEGLSPESVYVEDDFGLSMKIHPYSVLMIQQIDFEKAMEGDAIWQFNQKKIHDRIISDLAGKTIINRKI